MSEIRPHLSLKGGIHSFGSGICHVTVFSHEKSYSSVFQVFLESLVKELFSLVCLKVHGALVMASRILFFCGLGNAILGKTSMATMIMCTIGYIY